MWKGLFGSDRRQNGMVIAALATGRTALATGDWARARGAFEAALDSTADDREAAEAHQGLADALWWIGETEPAVRQATAAYACFRRLGERDAAVRSAVWLAVVHKSNYDDRVLADGWAARAERLLPSGLVGPLHGWVMIARAYRHPDLEQAERLIRAALASAEGIDVDLELVAMAQLGRLLVARGENGFDLLDEAVTASLAGEGVHLDTVVYTCCDMLVACEQAGDVLRAARWCARVEGFVERYSCPFLAAECRLAYGTVLLGTGRWSEGAEQLRVVAVSGAGCGAPALANRARARLALLHVRRGDLESAEALLASAGTSAAAALATAELALARDAPEEALQLLDPCEAAEPSGRAEVLAVMIEALVGSGQADEAARRVVELRRLAAAIHRPHIEALALMGAGRVAGLAGDPSAAAESFRAAERLLTDLGLSHELAECRLQLALLLRSDRPARAIGYARAALSGYRELGAHPGADRAAAALREMGVHPSGGPRRQERLTAREQEVLTLIGLGLTNPEIAGRLHISRRTVGHHVSRVLSKLDLRNRAAAAAWTAGRPDGS